MNESTRVARRLVRALVASGVRDVVCCPGSRDAPLIYALDRAEQRGWLRLHVRLDERSAAFMALGLSKAAVLSGRDAPAAVVTTSGTAVANLHPAVLEADAAGVPLLVCSADRPHEMWQTGANQTTRQAGIFGAATRFEASVAAGYPADSRLDALVLRAVTAATGALDVDPGPVHLNVCLRDPLVPDPQDGPDDPDESLTPTPRRVNRPEPGPTPVSLPGRTVVVAGDGAGPGAEALALAGGWPLLAEPSSGARRGPNALVDYQGVLATGLGEEVEAVLVVGHPTLSRPISRLLAGPAAVTVVADRSRWTDVAGIARVAPGPIELAHPGVEAGWLRRWQQADSTARAAARPRLKDRICADLWRASTEPGSPTLVIGASDVIRSFDRHAEPADHSPIVVSNRGLAGIDGTVSTALGLEAGLGRPTRVVVGDLAAAHDLTALLRGTDEPEPDLQVVVLNDHGGAIFAGLEHAAAPREVLRRFFLTPQVLDLGHVAQAVGAAHRRVGDTDFLAEPVRGRSIVEVDLPAL